MALALLLSPAEKWNKLCDDFSVSSQMAAEARTRFASFRKYDGETVVEIQHKFDGLSNECAIQGVPVDEAAKTLALMAHPNERFRQFMDNYVNHSPAPTATVIFAQMKLLEERWSFRNEREHAEANYAGRGSGAGGSGGGPRWEKAPGGGRGKQQNSVTCWCCGQPTHYVSKCEKKTATCLICKMVGHVAAMCRKKGQQGAAGGVGGSGGGAAGGEGAGKPPPPPLLKPKLLPYARKKELAKEQACVLEEAFPAVAESEVVEWPGDTGASRHVCNDRSLMWDVVTRREPIVLRQLVGELKVYTMGTVKLQCWSPKGKPVVMNMLNTLLIPEAKVNLFSLQKLRKALFVTDQADQLGI